MHEGRLVLSQLLDFFPRYEFNKCVARYRGNHRVRKFPCFDHFLSMAFAQLTHRDSLRDIEICLDAMDAKRYHAGFRSRVARSTLSDANERRDWRIWADLAAVLIRTARDLYAGEDFGLELDQTVYALDSSTIDLCLSLFPWARFRKHKGGIKIHTLLDLRGSIPSVVFITDAKVHDVNILDELLFEPGSIYLMDRAYVDFARLYAIHLSGAFFVTRAKGNFQFKRLYSHPVDKSTGLQCDQTIVLKNFSVKKDYPTRLRRVRYFDADENSRLVFLTNNFTLPALTITKLYKCRWYVELFFKWIKQHLRIKKFFGTSQNAVKTQIWIAISVYVLVAIVKKRLKLDLSLYTILQILSVTLFEKTPILQALSQHDYTIEEASSHTQLDLFDF